MDRSNIRESRSFVENEANLHTMKTIHSLDAMYKTYVPPTAPKNVKSAPSSQPASTCQSAPTPILKPPNIENLIKPLISATPYQSYGIYPPRVQFSYIPCFTDPRNNVQLNPQVSAMRMVSGQMNRRCGTSFDSTGNESSPTCVVPTNNVTFAEPQPCNGSFYSQKGYYGNPAFSGFENAISLDHYRQKFLSDQGIGSFYNQQSSPGAGCADPLDHYRQQFLSDQGIGSFYNRQSSSGADCCSCLAPPECCRRYPVSDNGFDNTYQEEGKSSSSCKSMCSSDEKKSSDPQISDDCTPTSSDGCTAAASAYPLSAICTNDKESHNDKCICCSNGVAHHSERKCRRVRIAGDSSSQDSVRSSSSRNSVCSDTKSSMSTRGFIMPDPEDGMICGEPENNCSGPSACDSQPKLTCPPMICWDGCNVANTNKVNNCYMDSTYLNGCYLNDALQDCTVYNMDYKPIMCVCNHLYQHYGGCSWQDLPLGGGCGPCGACGSCGGYGPSSNLPDCYPFPFDSNRYIPPSATLDTCSRPFCDHYAEDPTKSNSHMSAFASVVPLVSAIEGCGSVTDCIPPPACCDGL